MSARAAAGRAVVSTLLTLVLCAGIAGEAAAQARTKVTVGENAAIALFWPDFIAARKGFYAREGLDVETIFSGGSAQSVQQLVGGALDVVFVSCAVPMFAIDKGAELAIIGQTLGKWPYVMMAGKDVKRAADVRGRKVILATPKDPTTIFWRRWLQKNAVKPAEVDEVFDGATPNRYASLANGAVAVALLTQPFDFRARDDGYVALTDFAEDDKDFAFVCVAARRAWLAENPERARGVLRAIASAIAWLYDPANKEEAIRILVEATKQTPALARQTYDYFAKVKPFTPGGRVTAASVSNLVELLKETGDLPASATAERFVDMKYQAP